MEEMSSETVTRDAIRSAHRRIAPHIRRTPVWNPAPGAFGYDGPREPEARVPAARRLVQRAGSLDLRKLAETAAA
jgi:hypothetical protein